MQNREQFMSSEVGMPGLGYGARETRIPRVGDRVLYVLNDYDAQSITAIRGLAAERGNDASGGKIFPMEIVAVHGANYDSYVNGKVNLDGPDFYWATSKKVGQGPGFFFYRD